MPWNKEFFSFSMIFFIQRPWRYIDENTTIPTNTANTTQRIAMLAIGLVSPVKIISLIVSMIQLIIRATIACAAVCRTVTTAMVAVSSLFLPKI